MSGEASFRKRGFENELSPLFRELFSHIFLCQVSEK